MTEPMKSFTAAPPAPPEYGNVCPHNTMYLVCRGCYQEIHRQYQRELDSWGGRVRKLTDDLAESERTLAVCETGRVDFMKRAVEAERQIDSMKSQVDAVRAAADRAEPRMVLIERVAHLEKELADAATVLEKARPYISRLEAVAKSAIGHWHLFRKLFGCGICDALREMKKP